ncbi:MAG: hypothetical protein IJF92_05660 [Bacilli bacterium]|nr:hypothetical protein [Bacilli bacterium]
MNCSDNRDDCNCFTDILKTILILQKKNACIDNNTGCDRPFLGPNSTNSIYNTRPVTLYNCCTGEPWSFPYTVGETTGDTTIFRVESLDDCCCTIRLLYPGTEEGTFLNTNQFVTINLNCVGAITCLSDTFVELG